MLGAIAYTGELSMRISLINITLLSGFLPSGIRVSKCILITYENALTDMIFVKDMGDYSHLFLDDDAEPRSSQKSTG